MEVGGIQMTYATCILRLAGPMDLDVRQLSRAYHMGCNCNAGGGCLTFVRERVDIGLCRCCAHLHCFTTSYAWGVFLLNRQLALAQACWWGHVRSDLIAQT